jgi:hypothetical protein
MTLQAAIATPTASWGETWKPWVERFWFLRGIAAAIALSLFASTFTDPSRVEFLRPVHALLLAWSDAAAWLGRLIGMAPWLPDLSGDVVAALVLAASLGAPIGYALAGFLFPSGRPPAWTFDEDEPPIGSASPSAGGLIFCVPLGMTASFAAFLTAVQAWREDLSLPLLYSGLTVYMFVAACFVLNGFLRGVLILLAFMGAFQALYWLNTPGLTDWVNAATASVPASR